MSTHDPHDPGHHEGPGVQAYLVIFGALSVFTLVSFVANYFARQGTISVASSFIVILTVAVVKAALVGTYFMHLILDIRRLYFLLIPAFILGTMLVFVLLPDIVLAWPEVAPR
jgi:cytochrome c oxidase subunit 4